MKSVDVLVVGLGPAGASAARAAAQAGSSVLAIDRKGELGTPVQCAEFLPMTAAARAPAGSVARRVRTMNTVLPSGAVAGSESPGVMLDRAAFDRGLAEEARRAGATLWTGSRLTALDMDARTASVSTPQGEAIVGFRLLVAADGPASAVACRLGMEPLPAMVTRQYTVPCSGAGDALWCWLAPEYQGGYAWLFPKAGSANLGLGVPATAAGRMRPLLDELHRRLRRAGRVGSDVTRATGGLVPVGGLRRPLVSGVTLFVGDAGGFAHPVTGAGIEPALASGEAAGAAAAAFLSGRSGALDEYGDEMRDRFEAAYARALNRTRIAGDDHSARRSWVVFPEYYAA